LLEGSLGDDLLISTAGNDTLAGFSGADTLVGGPGDGLLLGEGDDDLLFAGPGGADTLQGGAGNDILIAGESGAVLEGGADDDSLVGGRAGDAVRPNLLSGGAGDDAFVVYHGSFARVDVGTGSNLVVIEMPTPLAPGDPAAVTRIEGFDGVLDALVFTVPDAAAGAVPVVTAELRTAAADDPFGYAAGEVYTEVALDGVPAAVITGAYPGLGPEISVAPGAEARGLFGLQSLARADFLVA
jgi:hypothetical protein